MQRIEYSIDIDAPLLHCFNQWIQEDNYPHLKLSIEKVPWSRFHKLNRPDVKVEWAEMVHKSTDSYRAIWWRSRENELVETAGMVSFKLTESKQTQVCMIILCNLPSDRRISLATFEKTGLIIENRLWNFKTKMEAHGDLLIS